jgi:hypothetical protein
VKVRVHSFTMGDVDEVFLYAAGGVHQWLNSTEMGLWLLKKNINVEYAESFIENHYARTINIFADFTDKQYTAYALKFGIKNDKLDYL